jgi:hypothetical protein
LLAHGRWFFPASSITKTGCYDIAEILLKVALNTIKINQSINQSINQKSNKTKTSLDSICTLSCILVFVDYASMSVFFCMPCFSRYMLICGLLSRLKGIMALLHQQGD